MVRKSLLVVLIGTAVLVGTLGPDVFGSGATRVDGQPDVVERSVSLRPADGAADSDRFSLDITSVERCGATCGTVSGRLTNAERTPATNVTIHARIFAGRSIEDGERIWDDTETLRTVAAGGSRPFTRRVAWSFGDAAAVESRDGWVTIAITITSDQASVTFTAREQVA